VRTWLYRIATNAFGGAVGAAGELPAPVLEADGDAFVQGLQLAALTGALLMGVTAAVAALVLRRDGRRANEEECAAAVG
jgi:hypothetical protein